LNIGRLLRKLLVGELVKYDARDSGSGYWMKVESTGSLNQPSVESRRPPPS